MNLSYAGLTPITENVVTQFWGIPQLMLIIDNFQELVELHIFRASSRIALPKRLREGAAWRKIKMNFAG